MARRLAILLVLWIPLWPEDGHARTPELRFEHVTIDQGLSQNSVYAILQDRTGFLWFGTSDGLNRYDGFRFEVLRNRPGNAESLSHNRVRALCERRDGSLWVGTRNGGVNRYDRKTGTSTRYQNDPADPRSLAHANVWELYEDRRGTLWVGTGGGLDRFEEATGTFTHFRHDPADPRSLSQDSVKVLYEDRSDRFWVGTMSGLNRLDPATGTFESYLLDPDQGDGLDYNAVTAIHEDEQGRLWLGTHGGLVLFEPAATPPFTYFRHRPDRPNDPNLDSVWDLYADADGILWLATFGGGLLRFDPETGGFSRHRHDPGDPASLSDDKVTLFLADRSGVLWIGTASGGLNKFDQTRKAFTHYGTAAPPALSDDMVMAIHEDRDGILWIGTWNGGADRIDRAAGTVTSYRADRDDPRRLARDDVRALLEDRQGNLWAGTEGGGLHRLDRATGTFTRYRHDPRDPRSLRDDDAWVLYEDRAGNLWVGTYGGGLSRYDPETDGFTHFVHDADDPESLANDIVRALHEDPQGHLWVGTGGGLDRMDATGRFTHYRHATDDPRSISSDEVLCLLADRAGTLWIGTHGGGLDRLPLAGPESGFRSFTEEDGLPSNVIYGILEDDEGRLWMSTNHGLSRLDPRTETFRNFDVTDGLQSNEFNSGAYFRSRHGEMFFGGIKGVNAFFPDQVRDDPYVPPVVLTSIKKFNEEIPLAGDVASVTELVLRPHETVVSFEFAALSYTAPQRNRYAYRLEGFRDQWTELGVKRDITFTNLNPGAYTLHVRGSNSDGVWNDDGLRVKLIVEPPFWRTWWFIAVSVTVVVGALWSGYEVRTRSMRRHALALESEIAERRRAEKERERLIAELEAKNQELAGRNAEMERFTYTVSHDLKAPLVTIKGFLGLLREDMTRGAAERMDDDIACISGAADKMRLLLEDLLELSRVGRLMNPPEDVALAELVRETLAQLAGQVAERGVTVEVDDAMPNVHGDRIRLFEVYQNLIDNAIKFMGDQPSPRVEIGARLNGRDEVLCWVRDNGIGLESRYFEKIFGLFERLEPEIDGTGVGLTLVRRIVEVHGGRTWVESEGPGRGSTVYFTLPPLRAT